MKKDVSYWCKPPHHELRSFQAKDQLERLLVLQAPCRHTMKQSYKSKPVEITTTNRLKSYGYGSKLGTPIIGWLILNQTFPSVVPHRSSILTHIHTFILINADLRPQLPGLLGHQTSHEQCLANNLIPSV